MNEPERQAQLPIYNSVYMRGKQKLKDLNQFTTNVYENEQRSVSFLLSEDYIHDCCKSSMF